MFLRQILHCVILLPDHCQTSVRHWITEARSPSCFLGPRAGSQGAATQGVFLSVVVKVFPRQPSLTSCSRGPYKGFLETNPELPPGAAAQCFPCCLQTTSRQSYHISAVFVRRQFSRLTFFSEKWDNLSLSGLFFFTPLISLHKVLLPRHLITFVSPL